jgi:hypothetical protein
MSSSLSLIRGGSNLGTSPLMISSNRLAASPILPLLINPSRKYRLLRERVGDGKDEGGLEEEDDDEEEDEDDEEDEEDDEEEEEERESVGAESSSSWRRG